MKTSSGVITALLVGSMAMVSAQRGAPRPVIPVAANTVAANPDAYYGKLVTLTGAVEHVLSPSTFAVAQRTVPGVANAAAMTREVLVVAPYLQGPVPAKVYVTVIGEVVRFDPGAIAAKIKDRKLDFAPDLVAKYQGQPVIVATGVLDSSKVNLSRRLPPPMSAEETAYAGSMKRIAPAFAALRGAIDTMNTEAVKQHAAVLGPAFSDVEAFWKVRGTGDAIKWSQDARQQVASIEQGLATGQWEEMRAQAGRLGQACQSCHNAFRERFDDGSFRINTEPK